MIQIELTGELISACPAGDGRKVGTLSPKAHVSWIELDRLKYGCRAVLINSLFLLC